MSDKNLVIQAIEANDRDALLEALAAHPELATAATGEVSPLLTAIYHGRPPLAAALMDHGVIPNTCEAAALGDTEELKAALHREPDSLNEMSADGWTPLHLAVFFGHYEAALLLLDAGADISTVANNGVGVTPLQSALAGKEARLADLLIERGADVNAQGSGGRWTPLHYSAENNMPEMAVTLLSHGAIADLLNADGESPLMIAVRKGNGDVADVLKPHGAG